MKNLLFLFFCFSFLCDNVSASIANIPLEGKASWIGERFQGKKTASGELFDLNDLTASHATLPFGTNVRVTSEKTKKSVIVRINNRSEIDSGRIIDLSRRAAEQIGLIEEGIGFVKLEVLSQDISTGSITNSSQINNNNGNLNISHSQFSSNNGSYRIQYGSFFDQDNAQDFKIALKNKGIDSKIETNISNSGKTVYRLFGTLLYDTREKAQQSLNLLSPQEGLILLVKKDDSISQTKPVGKINNKNFEFGVQFGAFTILDYAKELQTKLLREKGVKSLVHKFPDDEKKLYRVLSDAPFSSREEADSFIKKYNVTGTILTFLKE